MHSHTVEFSDEAEVPHPINCPCSDEWWGWGKVCNDETFQKLDISGKYREEVQSDEMHILKEG